MNESISSLGSPLAGRIVQVDRNRAAARIQAVDRTPSVPSEADHSPSDLPSGLPLAVGRNPSGPWVVVHSPFGPWVVVRNPSGLPLVADHSLPSVVGRSHPFVVAAHSLPFDLPFGLLPCQAYLPFQAWIEPCHLLLPLACGFETVKVS